MVLPVLKFYFSSGGISCDFPKVCVVPGVPVAVREVEEWVQDFVDHLSGEEMLRVILFWKEKLMTMIVLLIS